ncbi:CCDC90 family protein [Rugamonas rivuli]|uniref:DUF1640 domain-containing protein n=1 Tax=Rugamonas rivuli TaxID=2743358 RepID=A0A843SL09_9BURK|nr:hypothetical protein [Rugamonas rivuli]MQA22771.1 hypothetical protein [Rugamonas rivuli]
MNMPIKFDTLSYARKLEEAGLPQQQAEAQSLALRDALAESTVTPGDMLLLKTDLIARLEILRSDLQGQIDTLKAQIAELKAHMNIRFNILYMLTGLSLVLHGVTLGVLFKILSRLP